MPAYDLGLRSHLTVPAGQLVTTHEEDKREKLLCVMCATFDQKKENRATEAEECYLVESESQIRKLLHAQTPRHRRENLRKT